MSVLMPTAFMCRLQTSSIVARLWAVFSPPASRQFNVEDVLGNTAVLPTAHMAQPAQTALPEDGVHAG